MKISIASLFPELYTTFFSTSIIGRAKEKNIYEVNIINMFDYVDPKKRVDSDIVGHGDGMLINVSLIEKIYNAVIRDDKLSPFTIFFSPHGRKLTQDLLCELYQKIKDSGRKILLFSGRYEGFDVRAEEQYANEIISIGDYVLAGGDLPIMVFLEGLLRLIPGVVGKIGSVINDSFSSTFLDCPHYSNPDEWHNRKIPAVLKSGNHSLIKDWRAKEAVKRSIYFNWQWTQQHLKNINDKNLVKSIMPSHYCVLLHNDVMMPNGESGNSSVTSIDIHDIARSSTTYGIKKYFIVTRTEAQRKIVEKFLLFWQQQEDAKIINNSRAFALKNVILVSELEDAFDYIEKIEGKKPISIVTSSRRNITHHDMISYYDQGKIWRKQKPIVFIFGTSHGIDPKLMDTFDYRLLPIEGLEEFNFLSVRSAVAIIFDRWFGCNNIK